MSDNTSAFLTGIAIGFIVGALVTLCAHSDAINEHKFREYKQHNTNSVIEFNEWKRLKDGR
jgi:gas vesicle protein